MKPIRMRQSSTEVVVGVVKTTSVLARDISDAMQFPPARAAAGLLVIILETIEGLRRNKDDCVALAERATRILLDVQDQMAGRWDDAPDTLLRGLSKLEGTLRDMQEYMEALATARWTDRLMGKRSIEEDLKSFRVMLEDAARSFQIASLIDIQYTLHQAITPGSPGLETTLVASPTETIIGSPTSDSFESKQRGPKKKAERYATMPRVRSASSTLDAVIEKPYEQDPVSKEDERKAILERKVSAPPAFEDVPAVPTIISSPPGSSRAPSPPPAPPLPCSTPTSIMHSLLTDHGLPRLHQSQVRLSSRAPRATPGRFHAGARAVQVTLPSIPPGTAVYMVRYDGPGPDAKKQWRRDVEMLWEDGASVGARIVGVSSDNTPVPFVLVVDAPGDTPV